MRICFYILFYSYKFFELEILSQYQLSNKTQIEVVYWIERGKQFEYLWIIFGLVHSLIRDGLCVIVLIIFNLLMLFYLKKSFEKKKKIVVTRPSGKRERKENKMTMMVFVAGSISIISHLALIIVYSFNYKLNECLTSFVYFMYDFSFSISFLVCFFFNKSFYNCFKDMLQIKICF